MTRTDLPSMDRRHLLGALGVVIGAARGPRAQAQAVSTEPAPFDPDLPRRMAQALAAKPYAAPSGGKRQLEGLSYDQYRAIRFNRDRELWGGQGLDFRAHFFPPAFLYPRPVTLFEVEGGAARPVTYAPDYFVFPPDHPASGEDMGGFSGFKLLWPLNRPNVRDEIGVFQGASYFRSLGRGQFYGASARGLAVRTGENNEEFPAFTTFWIERPERHDGAVTVHALLDGPSCAGAYRFVITPDQNTRFDVSAVIHPRVAMDKAGVGAMSSMFLFGLADHGREDDFRGGVHDSDGLAVWTGAGERIWRPLANPKSSRVTAYPDQSPKGFGLIQRERDVEILADLEARYDKRPSLWVEPLEDWGAGAVHLVELATKLETDDNIAVFWRPAQAWEAGREVRLNYRIHFGVEPYPAALAHVRRTRGGAIAQEGAAGGPGARMFAVDFVGGAAAAPPADLAAQVECPGADLLWSTVQPSPAGGVRAAFGFKPKGDDCDLTLRLVTGGRPASETWRMRWTG
jgi:periplasmic glucans biosynthesis protein